MYMNTKDESFIPVVEFVLSFLILEWHRACPFLFTKDLNKRHFLLIAPFDTL